MLIRFYLCSELSTKVPGAATSFSARTHEKKNTSNRVKWPSALKRFGVGWSYLQRSLLRTLVPFHISKCMAANQLPAAQFHRISPTKFEQDNSTEHQLQCRRTATQADTVLKLGYQ